MKGWYENSAFQDTDSRPNQFDWEDLEIQLRIYPGRAEPHSSEIDAIRSNYPTMLFRRDALSAALGEALSNEMGVFEEFLLGGAEALVNFLIPRAEARQGFEDSLSPEFQAIYSTDEFSFDELLKVYFSNRFPSFEGDIIDQVYASFVGLQNAFSSWWDGLTGSGEEGASGTSLSEYAVLGSLDSEVLRGLEGNDKIYGLDGADVIHGEAGNDHIEGNDDNDSLYGGADSDYLYGGEGDDKLYGGEGTDYLIGGEGSDTYYFVDGDGTDFIDDVDAGDRININGKTITSLVQTAPDSNIYEDSDGSDNVYVVGQSGGLTITVKNGTEITGTIKVDKFHRSLNNFGIVVNGSPALETPPTPPNTGYDVAEGYVDLGDREVDIRKTWEARDADANQTFINENGIYVNLEAIIRVSEIIRGTIRKSDIAARFGGDEFMLLLYVNSLDEVAVICDTILSAIERNSSRIDEPEYQLGASLGVGHTADHTVAFKALLKAADSACYKAKKQGKGQVCFTEVAPAGRVI